MNCEVGPSKSSLKEDFLSSPFKGDGRGSILFPLRENFVTLKGCKKCDKISLDFHDAKLRKKLGGLRIFH